VTFLESTTIDLRGKFSEPPTQISLLNLNPTTEQKQVIFHSMKLMKNKSTPSQLFLVSISGSNVSISDGISLATSMRSPDVTAIHKPSKTLAITGNTSNEVFVYTYEQEITLKHTIVILVKIVLLINLEF
jgi:hypothetical protein